MSGYLIKDLGSTSCKLDQAFFTKRKECGSLMIMMTVHVDDLLVVTDGSREAEACVDQMMKKYGITDVKSVSQSQGGVEYTGQTIEIKPGPQGDEAHVHQKKFIWRQVRSDPDL